METKEQLTEYKENAPSKLGNEPPVYSLLHFIWPMIAAFVVAVIALSVTIPICRKAKSIGEGIAELPGKEAGKAIGSYQGFTEGIALGAEAGKEAGVSAENSEVKIEDEIVNIGNLEVLVAGVRIGNFHEYANKYNALYIYKADAVFSVDLSKAKIYHDSNNRSVFIYLPKPQVKLYINEGVEKLAEWQKSFYTGDAKDGYMAYLNSMKNIENISPKEISDYEMLMEQAKEAAERQVGMLAKAACQEEVSIKVICGEEGE